MKAGFHFHSVCLHLISPAPGDQTCLWIIVSLIPFALLLLKWIPPPLILRQIGPAHIILEQSWFYAELWIYLCCHFCHFLSISFPPFPKEQVVCSSLFVETCGCDWVGLLIWGFRHLIQRKSFRKSLSWDSNFTSFLSYKSKKLV